MSTLDQIDEAVRAHYAAEAPDEGPVIAWVLVAATDNQGSVESDVIWIATPEGQRGLFTTALIAEASGISAARREEGGE